MTYHNVPASNKLTRSTTDKWFAGIFGGLAEKYGVSSTMLRLITVAVIAFTFVTFPAALIVYLIAWMMIPQG